MERKRSVWMPWCLLLLAALLTMFVAACGGGAGGGQQAAGGDSSAGGAATQASGGYDASAEGVQQAEGGVAPMVGPAAQPTAAAGHAPTDQAADTGPSGRLVIQTANLSVQVQNLDTSISQVQQLAANLDGYIQSSSKRQEGKQEVADLTILVPVNRFADALDAVRKMSKKVVSESTQGQDVTEEYVDLQSRQRNLEATENSLIALMSKANTVGDVLNVQRELTTVQGELEQIQGRMKYLKSKAAMSTITVSMRPVVTPASKPAKPEPSWSPVRVAERAWNASLRVLQGIATVAIAVVVFLWWLLPLLLVALFVGRRVLRTRRATAAAGSSQSPAA